ncbi:hypothetical protein M011DRAFT_257386 [Sporormia fimetaria CBS 119925]|uniref:Uncharacterized protein n=1 Tax=Sporormia fimetaria CBS 119925 TaxID=1340428 RepID=A0A6A6V0Q9_9PLEO|nr:hypothetical protein M011DRAFT_257386 [Sporormia fimetaria CBS 119925]
MNRMSTTESDRNAPMPIQMLVSGIFVEGPYVLDPFPMEDSASDSNLADYDAIDHDHNDSISVNPNNSEDLLMSPRGPIPIQKSHDLPEGSLPSTPSPRPLETQTPCPNPATPTPPPKVAPWLLSDSQPLRLWDTLTNERKKFFILLSGQQLSTIPRHTITPSPVAITSELGSETICTYNWKNSPADSPTIFVSGAPPRWNPPPLPCFVPEDTDISFVNEDQYRSRFHGVPVFEPMFQAISVMRPTFAQMISMLLPIEPFCCHFFTGMRVGGRMPRLLSLYSVWAIL